MYADLTDNSVYNFRGVIEKNGLFTDRLTVRVDPPPPLPSSFFVHFFGVCLTLDYDYMCSETDLTQEKSHFHPTTRIPNSSLLFAAALS